VNVYCIQGMVELFANTVRAENLTQHIVMINVMSLVYRAGQLIGGLLPELNPGSSGNNDTTCVSKTSSNIEVNDHEGSSSGSEDVKHFVEVYLVDAFFKRHC